MWYPIIDTMNSREDEKEVSYSECNFCCNDGTIRDYLIHDGSKGVFIDKDNYMENDLENIIFNNKINYCPMCGRELK